MNSILICNLNSEYIWYDTYQHVIDFFLENKILIYLTKEDLEKYFNRKILKPTQMKESYGLGVKNAVNEFLNNIPKNELDLNKKKEILNLFLQFY